MKKTRIVVAMLLVFMMAFTFVLAACKPDEGHKHTFEEAWTWDASQHWHKSTCEHADAVSGRTSHDFGSDNKCKVCGYEKGAQHACESKCPVCQKCTNAACTEAVCADKCQGHSSRELLPYADGTVLRIAAGYNNAKTGITFDSAVAGTGITLSDGHTYNTDSLKPTWVQIQNNMKITFENKYSGKSATNEYSYWIGDADRSDEIDILSGTAEKLQAGGTQGLLVNLADYLDKMPNFKAYLDANAIVRLSITGSTTGANAGAIYFSPYFDGVDDIERYPLIRSDMLKALLDGSAAYTGDNRAVNTSAYTPYMPTSGSISIDSLNADGTATQTITKDYSKTQNIIAQMNAASNLTGDQAVAMFRAYIDSMYAGVYQNRSDLFLGYNAAWDVDELVALLRCAVASLHDNNGDPITGLYSRETTNTQREVDLFRFAGSLFGVRGMESRSDYLYFDKDGQLHDARQEVTSYEAVMKMNQINQEGLIALQTKVSSADRLKLDAGIVSYDYCQTQTIYNDSQLQDGEEYTVMMVPVAHWFDGTSADGVWMRFTESWRSVKTEGWGITVKGVAGNQDKLNAALALIDFAFSPQGQITMSYGSDDFIKVKDANVEVKTWADVSKKYETFNFNGQEMPVVSDGLLRDLKERTGGNYTDFARQYLGSTLNGFPKSQAFEYQCTHAIGQAGAAKVSAAIALGTVKHPLLAVNTENMWYTSVPTTLPHTTNETTALNGYTDLSTTKWSSSSGQNINVFIEIIKLGWSNEAISATSPETAANVVKTEWNGAQYLLHKQNAWNRLLDYYNAL